MRKLRWLPVFVLLILITGSLIAIYLFIFTDYKYYVLNLLAYNIPTNTHMDSERKFSFQYPKTWKYIEDWDLEFRNKNFVVGIMQQTIPGVACGVIVDERPDNLTYESSKAILQLDNSLSQTYPDFRKLQAKGFTFKELPAIDYAYNFTRTGTAIYARLEQRIIYSAFRIYTIACGSPESRFGEFTREFNLIFDSFKIEYGQ